MTDLPNLLTTMGQVAPVRSKRPIYLDMLPPCNAGCPVGKNIQEWLRSIRTGQHEAAWRQLTANNPFPAVHSRVCYHLCETACNRKGLDAVVSIHSVERYLGDLALERGWRSETPSHDSERQMLIIGAGPSGLSTAYHLRRLGHEVETHNSTDVPGGMMRYGISEYRLPRDVLGAEVARIANIGVMIRNNTPVTDLLAAQVAGRFDAVFVAIDVHLPKHMDIPSADATRMAGAVGFLRDVAKGEKPVIECRIAVYGGDSTAMDTARVARHLDAEESMIVYRRTVEQMPAHTEERESAEQGGMRINWLRTITGIGEENLTVGTMEPDEEDRAYGTGRFEKLAADTAILAVRQEADIGFLHAIPGMIFDRGVVRVDSGAFMTNAPGIFTGGDMVPSERTVTVGVGHGKKAARYIDKWLSLDVTPRDPKHPLVHLDQMNLQYFDGHTRRVQAEQTPETHVSDFGEIIADLNPKETELKARRCLSCDNCSECGGYYGTCPEDATIKLGSGNQYRFDYERYTGCAACYEQCPVHAIEMIPEGQR